MTTVAISEGTRGKLGQINKFINFSENKDENLGETIDRLADLGIKKYGIKISN